MLGLLFWVLAEELLDRNQGSLLERSTKNRGWRLLQHTDQFQNLNSSGCPTEEHLNPDRFIVVGGNVREVLIMVVVIVIVVQRFGSRR